MDTNNIAEADQKRKQKQSAILVDFNMYSHYPTVQRWVELRENKTQLVLLISDPVHNDFDPTSSRWANGPEWAAVLTNTGGTKDLVFKTSALCVVQDMSNLLPVIALDDDLHVQQMFEDGGVLLAMGEKDLMYV